MKREIEVKFHSAVSDATKKYFIELLKEWYDVKESKKYDYYFAMETIYKSRKEMRELLEADDNSIKIMLCGEAIYPDLNLFDYAIWHFGYFQSLDRIIQSPYLHTQVGYLFESIDEIDNSKKNIDPEVILNKKSRFCNFMYSNPRAHYKRDEIFYAISEYKHVDSLGTHLKNVEIEDTRFVNGWERKSIELKKPYKFSIAAENAVMPGYSSEKLITSMLANTIPIYFGNPKVGDMFNSKAFIEVSSFDTLNDLVDYVREVDENDKMYCDIMSEPWRTDKQIKEYEYSYEQYLAHVKAIFEKEKEKAKRRSLGTWGSFIYPEFMGENNWFKNPPFIKKINNLLRGKSS